MTNQERFIASCHGVGEADVRQKLSANRYSSQKALWASDWLEQQDGAKSDSTRADEGSSRLPKPGPNLRSSAGVAALLLVLLLVSVVLFLKFG